MLTAPLAVAADAAGPVPGVGLICIGAIEADGEPLADSTATAYVVADLAATAPASRREAASAAVAAVPNVIFMSLPRVISPQRKCGVYRRVRSGGRRGFPEPERGWAAAGRAPLVMRPSLVPVIATC